MSINSKPQRPQWQGAEGELVGQGAGLGLGEGGARKNGAEIPAVSSRVCRYLRHVCVHYRICDIHSERSCADGDKHPVPRGKLPDADIPAGIAAGSLNRFAAPIRRSGIACTHHDKCDKQSCQNYDTRRLNDTLAAFNGHYAEYIYEHCIKQ